ncbi:hypothetical protein Zm00014a_044275 [Zea mays]|nr:hypothetical protein Zm00014a_044275 [Zea mays]
MCILHLI